MREKTEWLDQQLSAFGEGTDNTETTIDTIIGLLERCVPNPEHGAEMWDIGTIKAALEQIKTLYGVKAYITVRRDRALFSPRRETQGIYSGKGDESYSPHGDAPTLLMYRTTVSDDEIAVWWPQLTFTDGNYFLAFSFDR